MKNFIYRAVVLLTGVFVLMGMTTVYAQHNYTFILNVQGINVPSSLMAEVKIAGLEWNYPQYQIAATGAGVFTTHNVPSLELERSLLRYWFLTIVYCPPELELVDWSSEPGDENNFWVWMYLPIPIFEPAPASSMVTMYFKLKTNRLTIGSTQSQSPAWDGYVYVTSDDLPNNEAHLNNNKFDFLPNTVVTITASPKPGFRFSHFAYETTNGDFPLNQDVTMLPLGTAGTITMTSDKNVGAVFLPEVQIQLLIITDIRLGAVGEIKRDVWLDFKYEGTLVPEAVMVRYWRELGGEYQTLKPVSVSPEGEGRASLRIDVDANTEKGFFRVIVE